MARDYTSRPSRRRVRSCMKKRECRKIEPLRFSTVALVSLVAIASTFPSTIGNAQTQQSVSRENRGAALHLTEEQRRSISEAVRAEDTHQATPEKFNPAVGAALPSTVNLHSFPRPLIYQLPVLKQYFYGYLDENIIIVDAMAKRVVAVLPLGPRQSFSDQSGKSPVEVVGGLADLSAEQLQRIYQGVAGEPQPVPPDTAIYAGAAVPQAIALTPLPPSVESQSENLRGAHYARLEDGRLILADGGNRMVTGVSHKMKGPAPEDRDRQAPEVSATRAGSSKRTAGRAHIRARRREGRTRARRLSRRRAQALRDGIQWSLTGW